MIGSIEFEHKANLIGKMRNMVIINKALENNEEIDKDTINQKA